MVNASVKRLLPEAFKRRLREMAGVPTMAGRMQNLKRAGFSCSGAVDGGAFDGDWARLCRTIFQCPVWALEPLPRDGLRKLVAADPQLQLVEAALCEEQQDSVEFLEQGSNSRMPDHGSRRLAGDNLIQVPATTLDVILDGIQPTPNLLKLDLQGAELKALRGGQKYLNAFEVVICEVSVIPIGEVPDVHEMIDFFRAQGYQLYDFLPAYFRPLDGALWQADAFFVSSTSPLVASTRWD